MRQGKKLPDSKIQEIAGLDNMANGGKKIAKKAKERNQEDGYE